MQCPAGDSEVFIHYETSPSCNRGIAADSEPVDATSITDDNPVKLSQLQTAADIPFQKTKGRFQSIPYTSTSSCSQSCLVRGNVITGIHIADRTSGRGDGHIAGGRDLSQLDIVAGGQIDGIRSRVDNTRGSKGDLIIGIDVHGTTGRKCAIDVDLTCIQVGISGTNICRSGNGNRIIISGIHCQVCSESGVDGVDNHCISARATCDFGVDGQRICRMCEDNDFAQGRIDLRFSVTHIPIISECDGFGGTGVTEDTIGCGDRVNNRFQTSVGNRGSDFAI
ncbi:hypothetical protein V6x_13210 [Gimesia chilikensis]|uniref:Uncharacterized protein n=1 Tax=Gimesia chilikensis TaxID=2605989 RepID=A0A517W8R8_9PLAN|nr:hypothetical protein V6x_13210 [Gimesia chilikensis]